MSKHINTYTTDIVIKYNTNKASHNTIYTNGNNIVTEIIEPVTFNGNNYFATK